jgi:hypothetical protein
MVLPVDDAKQLENSMINYRHLYEEKELQQDSEDEEEKNSEMYKEEALPEDKDEIEEEAAVKEENDQAIKIYDRKASDSGRNDDVMFTKLRETAWKKLSKKSRYIMIYSSQTDRLIDINEDQTAKAWAVLYHFRGKTTESMLFEEFNAVA